MPQRRERVTSPCGVHPDGRRLGDHRPRLHQRHGRQRQARRALAPLRRRRRRVWPDSAHLPRAEVLVMIDVVLLFARIVLVALLYLFLFAAIKAGIGMVGGRATKAVRGLALRVTNGPREITGISVPLSGPVVIGRSPDA